MKRWQINKNSLYINEVVCVCRRIHVPTYVRTYVSRYIHKQKTGNETWHKDRKGRTYIRTYVCKRKYIKMETCMRMKTKMEMEMENVHKSIQTNGYNRLLK